MRRFWIKATPKTVFRLIGFCLLLCLFGVFYVHKVEPAWIDVNSVRLTLPHLEPEFHGYRIVQLSDIHADIWMTQNRLKSIVQQVNQQKPDLVVLTGDYVTRDANRFASRLTPLSLLAPGDRTVSILGNHDYWTDSNLILQVLTAAGITNLKNSVYTLQRGTARLQIAGLDDVWARKARLDLVLERLPREGAAILLVHEPDFADISAATGRFDLQLSGHSHGGQASLPFLGAPVLPRYGQKYASGRYQVGDMIEYTNRGVGMVRPYIRFNCRPEITVFTLEAAG